MAGVLVVLEMFTGTFYLLMIAIGLVAGGLAALAGGGTAVQLAVAGIAGAIATYGLRRSKWGKTSRRDAQRDPNVNLDIGQTLVVDEWAGQQGGVRTARVMYRGAMWDVELDAHAQARPGTYVIREVRGNRLVVAESGTANL
ncbi:NfeD family protein [Noviherbaspirillum denitrificans]|uniref:NfeD family protein n=1 Tax=Noviherbaspirillum denitrificans TaxID=1968433 RepID=UPI00307897D1